MTRKLLKPNWQPLEVRHQGITTGYMAVDRINGFKMVLDDEYEPFEFETESLAQTKCDELNKRS